MQYKDLMPEVSGPGQMDDIWWARFGIEEAMLDDPETCMLPMPAHDRLSALLNNA